MKKLAIFLAIMLIPFTAFALDTISDNDLSDVTGQAGVSIYTNSIQIVKTGVTTTYIDYDDTPTYAGEKEFNIVTDDATTKIFFKGVDPLMIDIIDMSTLQKALGVYGLAMESTDFGDTGVMILLPNAIEIRNYGTTKTYYSGAVTARGASNNNEMISIGTTGGTTTIQHADMTWGNQAIVSWIGATPATFLDGDAVDAAAWRNSGTARFTTLGSHSDQIAIIITAHEDE